MNYWNQKLPALGGVYHSVNINLFAYTHQNPVKYTDPTGKFIILFEFQGNADVPKMPFSGAAASGIWLNITKKNGEWFIQWGFYVTKEGGLTPHTNKSLGGTLSMSYGIGFLNTDDPKDLEGYGFTVGGSAAAGAGFGAEITGTGKSDPEMGMIFSFVIGGGKEVHFRVTETQIETMKSMTWSQLKESMKKHLKEALDSETGVGSYLPEDGVDGDGDIF